MKKIRFQRILCATDLSEFSNRAVMDAADMARRLDATLCVCHVVNLPVVSMHGTPLVYPDSQVQEMEAMAREEIRSLMKNTSVPW
ncbi:universal stress protein, partial [Desulfosarcina sp. OttesenSCG-928-G10]|nr:universal stress protein [Desulfosarcina sp. OttesenSCG-928-G10]